MKVYIESIFLLNFLLDFMILYGTKKLLKIDCKFYRLILSSLLGACTIFLLWISISNMVLILCKIILSFFMNFVAFGRKKLFENAFYFYLLSIILGGFLELVHFQKNYYFNLFFILFSFPILFSIFFYEYHKYKEYHGKVYRVKICFQKKEYVFQGFLDTGNHLKSPFSHKPVILIDQAIPHSHPLYIPYKALNYEGLLECIKPDKIFIDEKEIQECLIGFSKQNFNHYHCILPSVIKEEL